MEIQAPITFTPKEKINNKNLAFCHIVNTNSVPFNSDYFYNIFEFNKIGIHLPDIEINEFFELEKRRNIIAVQNILEKVNQIMTRTLLNERALQFTVFVVLHEYGHWRHFIKSGLSPQEYILEENKYRNSLEKERAEIFKLPDYSLEKKIKSKIFNEKYNQIPSEIAANKYATLTLKKYMKKIRKKLGYTEDDLFNQMVGN